MEHKAWSRTLFEQEIYVQVTRLDNGITVLVTGGVCSHVGAVSVAEPMRESSYARTIASVESTGGSSHDISQSENIECQTIELSGHKEAVISEKWARTLAKEWNCPVTVQAGIHYDNASNVQIQQILKVTEELLEEIKNGMKLMQLLKR